MMTLSTAINLFDHKKSIGEWETNPPRERLASAYTGYESFKMRLAMTLTTPPEQRAEMRLKGALEEIDRAIENDRASDALASYEAALAFDPAFRDAKRLGIVARMFIPAIAADPAARTGAERIATLLAKLVDEWDAVSPLTELQTALGRPEAAAETLERFIAAHPQDVHTQEVLLERSWAKKDFAGVTGALEVALQGVDMQTDAASGLAATAAMRAGRERKGVPPRAYAGIFDRSRRILERAAEIDAQDRNHWAFLYLVLEQQVRDDPRSPDAPTLQAAAAKAKQRADELDNWYLKD